MFGRYNDDLDWSRYCRKAQKAIAQYKGKGFKLLSLINQQLDLRVAAATHRVNKQIVLATLP
ncbi:hypothetical protein BT69DRAFT_1344857 [Atractiella rhizophila]|nr:hypothetical protein BT69DRAFT_1344857 [Atractiella rhizophila]